MEFWVVMVVLVSVAVLGASQPVKMVPLDSNSLHNDTATSNKTSITSRTSKQFNIIGYFVPALPYIQPQTASRPKYNYEPYQQPYSNRRNYFKPARFSASPRDYMPYYNYPSNTNYIPYNNYPSNTNYIPYNNYPSNTNYIPYNNNPGNFVPYYNYASPTYTVQTGTDHSKWKPISAGNEKFSIFNHDTTTTEKPTSTTTSKPHDEMKTTVTPSTEKPGPYSGQYIPVGSYPSLTTQIASQPQPISQQQIIHIHDPFLPFLQKPPNQDNFAEQFTNLMLETLANKVSTSPGVSTAKEMQSSTEVKVTTEAMMTEMTSEMTTVVTEEVQNDVKLTPIEDLFDLQENPNMDNGSKDEVEVFEVDNEFVE